jgi:4-hydroxybenzoate polyprenyltransferase
VRVADLVELTRAPAAFSIPGDAWSGAAHAAAGGRGWAMPVASTCLYWSGMAFNDWCDRHVDAEERPERPIPSGRVSPDAALAVAAGLGAAGLGVAALLGGRSAVAVAAPLALMVVAYDAVAKDAAVGPLAMASTRGLDVLLGAHASPATAWQPALAMTAHTAGLTWLSRGEVHGTTSTTARSTVAVTAIVSALVPSLAVTRPSAPGRDGWLAVAAAVAGAAAYASSVGRAQLAAVSDPGAVTTREATVAGIRGMVPLQAGLVAAAGEVRGALALGAVSWAAGSAMRRGSPT